jgi:mRNA interferase YafQ
MTMREIRQTARFKKDYKVAEKRGLPKGELRAVIEALANDEPLPERCRPHMLSGNWSGHWECHIRADWLLIYKLTDNVMVLTLVRTGSHSDLFDE